MLPGRPWVGGGSGPHLPLGIVGQGLGPGEAQSQGQGVLWPQVLGGGCCLQPTMTPKVNEVSCVSGCMDAVCARLCSWAAGTTDEPGESSAENPGQGRLGPSARRRGRAGLAKGSRLAGGLGWDLSPGPEGCYGHVCVFLGVVSLFLHDWVSRIVCPNVCLHFHVSMYMHENVCMSTPACVHVCPCPCSTSATFTWSHASVSCVLSMFIHVSEFGRVPKRVWGVPLGLSVLLCVPVGCECVPLHVFLCGPVAPPQPLSPAPCLCPSW